MKTVTPVNETSFETPQFKSLKETPTKTVVIYKVENLFLSVITTTNGDACF